ncbi:hypothetical protein [Streptosporangium carneum]|nr:hypothetical protein [Streptosporangium carneum]
MKRPDRLDAEGKAGLEQILADCPELATTAGLVRDAITLRSRPG